MIRFTAGLRIAHLPLMAAGDGRGTEQTFSDAGAPLAGLGVQSRYGSDTENSWDERGGWKARQSAGAATRWTTAWKEREQAGSQQSFFRSPAMQEGVQGAGSREGWDGELCRALRPLPLFAATAAAWSVLLLLLLLPHELQTPVSLATGRQRRCGRRHRQRRGAAPHCPPFQQTTPPTRCYWRRCGQRAAQWRK